MSCAAPQLGAQLRGGACIAHWRLAWRIQAADRQAAASACRLLSMGFTPTVRCRNGGHSYMGYGTAAGVLTIDLSNLDRVVVSPDKKTAVVQVPGLPLAARLPIHPPACLPGCPL